MQTEKKLSYISAAILVYCAADWWNVIGANSLSALYTAVYFVYYFALPCFAAAHLGSYFAKEKE